MHIVLVGINLLYKINLDMIEKKKILQQLIERQQGVVADLKNSMESYKEAADLDEEGTRDMDDFSQQNVAKEAQLRLEQQLNRAQADLDVLEFYADSKYESVQAGALVQTDSLWFLVGLSLGSYEDGTMKLEFVSTGSPAFDSLLDKKINENFTLGKTNYKIKAIA